MSNLLGTAAALATAHRRVWDEQAELRAKDSYGFWHDGYLDALRDVAMASGVPPHLWPPSLREKPIVLSFDKPAPESPESPVKNFDTGLGVSPVLSTHKDAKEPEIEPIEDQLTHYRGGIVDKGLDVNPALSDRLHEFHFRKGVVVGKDPDPDWPRNTSDTRQG